MDSKSRKITWFLLKLVISAACIFYLITSLKERGIDPKVVELPAFFTIVIVVELALMVLNWCLEVKRWQLSVSSYEKISNKQAGIEVLAGVALNLVVPFTIGDFLARILNKKDMYKTTGAIVFNRLIMLGITLFVGYLGLVQFADPSLNSNYWFLGLFVLLLPVFVRHKFGRRIFSYFKETSISLLLKVLLLSIGRYSVYFVQFILLIWIFNPMLDLDVISGGVGWIFFFRTAIPSLFGGLGLREASALVYFQNIVPDITLILVPVILIWLINTFIPSLIGSILVWKLRSEYYSSSKDFSL